MARRTSPAQRAPQSREQAIVLLDRYAAIAAEVDKVAAEALADVAATKAAAAAIVAPLEAEAKEIVKAVKTWWAASIDELTGGKRKSIELAGCVLGYRMSPPKVHFAGGTDDVAAAALLGAGLGDALVRTSVAPDKPAILRQLEGEDADAAAALRDLGFAVRQSESFFIDVADALPPPPAA